MHSNRAHLSTRDVAQLFGVSVSTVNRQARAGTLSKAVVAKAPGRHGAYTFDAAAVTALLDAAR